MRGPAPKDPALRQRTNKASTKATLKAPAARLSRKPSLPEREEGWHEMTVRWWQDVWSSPMAGEYLKADVHGLYRLASLVEQFWICQTTPAVIKCSGPEGITILFVQNPTAMLSISAQIASQEQRYGLSPLDRRRLEWIVERAEEGKARKAPRRRAASEGDPRDLLRAVK